MGDRNGLTRTDRTNGYQDPGGYMQAKKTKLDDQNEEIRQVLQNRHKSMKTNIFKGVSINVNGRTKPTADELKRLILLNGGEYHPYYRYKTTKFMICNNLAHAKMKQLRPDDRIVLPEWITDSISAGHLLPYKNYQILADEPRGIREGDVRDIKISNEPNAKSNKRPLYGSKSGKNIEVTESTKFHDIRQMFSQATSKKLPTLVDIIDTNSSSPSPSPSTSNDSPNKKQQLPIQDNAKSFTVSSIDTQSLEKYISSQIQEESVNQKDRNTSKPDDEAYNNQLSTVARAEGQTEIQKNYFILDEFKNPSSTSKAPENGKNHETIKTTYNDGTKANKRSISGKKNDKTSPSKPKQNTIMAAFAFSAKHSNITNDVGPKATLSGTSDLRIILKLVEEWVGCPEGITDIDTACMIKFFFDLMGEKNFHTRLFEIVETFRERVVTYGRKEWIELFNNIITTVKIELSEVGDEYSQSLAEMIPLIE